MRGPYCDLFVSCFALLPCELCRCAVAPAASRVSFGGLPAPVCLFSTGGGPKLTPAMRTKIRPPRTVRADCRPSPFWRPFLGHKMAPFWGPAFFRALPEPSSCDRIFSPWRRPSNCLRPGLHCRREQSSARGLTAVGRMHERRFAPSHAPHNTDQKQGHKLSGPTVGLDSLRRRCWATKWRPFRVGAASGRCRRRLLGRGFFLSVTSFVYMSSSRPALLPRADFLARAYCARMHA